MSLKDSRLRLVPTLGRECVLPSMSVLFRPSEFLGRSGFKNLVRRGPAVLISGCEAPLKSGMTMGFGGTLGQATDLDREESLGETLGYGSSPTLPSAAAQNPATLDPSYFAGSPQR